MKHGRSAKTGVLIVAHGERGGSGGNDALSALGEKVGRELATWARVMPAVLNGTPSLSDAVAALTADGCELILIYPFFMSAGHFTRVRLPERLDAYCGSIPWRMLEPLGLDAALPGMIERHAREAAARHELAPDETCLLIVAHGSQTSPASAEAANALAARIRDGDGFAEIETAFLEVPPYLSDVIGSLRRSCLVVGVFTGDGLHAREDVPTALAATSRLYLGAVGTWPEVADLVATRLRETLATD